MRSAVSAILSAPAPESNMSHPDYRQTAHDHAALLIMVRHLGSKLNPRNFSRVYERISRQSSFRIKDSSGNMRTVSTRFVRSYPIENNEWGDFQTHRRVLGLICVGECTNTQEVSELCKIHESLRSKFSGTLYDSCCLFLGLQHDGTPYASSSDQGPASINVGEVTKETEQTNEKSAELVCRDNDDHHQSNPENITCKVPHPSRTLYYPSLDKCITLETDLQDFVSSLFWVLESKRLVSIGNIDKDKQPLLCAPFERKDLIGMDLESRTHRKRCIGRLRKQVGDLSLQAGLTADALEHYQAAADILRPANDWLWLAGAFEGLCAASVTLLYPHLRRTTVMQRIGSLTGEGFTSRTRLNSTGVGTVRSLPPDMDSNQHFLKNRLKFKHSLGPEEVIEKYHEAVVHYSKYRNAGVIETEASIKAVHVLIEQRKFLSAAEFLQNVVFINLHLSDEEKIQRFTALSELYSQLGFRRKSSFFRRVSAMRCVAPMTTIQPNWTLCYQLLLESIGGFKLSLDPVLLSPDRPSGWPALQVQILQELTGTARRLGNVPLAIRHASLLVHLLLIQQQQGAAAVLSSQEQAEMAKQLEQLSQRSEMPLHPGPLALDNGTIIPPVPLTLLPKVVIFKLQPPETILAAQRLIPEDDNNHGPFLFTPIQFGSFRKQLPRKNQIEMDFQWVEGDSCEVLIQVVNPSSYELRITNMQLLTEDVEFETEPANIVLPPMVDEKPLVSTIILNGVPRSPGLLKIVGYSMTVLGLKNQCKLKSVVPNLGSPFYSIRVVPALPRLSVQIASPNNSSAVNTSELGNVTAVSSIQLYAGQSTECDLTLVNTSNVLVESFDLEITHATRSSSCQVFNVSVDNLKDQLPWQSGAAVSVTVYVQGASDFIMPTVSDCNPNTHQNTDDSNSLPSLSGPPSIFSRLSNYTAVTGSPRSKTKRTESLVSVRSGASSIRSGGSSNLNRANESLSSRQIAPRTVAAVLKLQYSGGPGFADGFCRSNSIALTVEILPSVIITKWDVLPAETPSHCYLVLDILNATPHEMELQYGSSKHIAIEALDSCRIPVPVERCPLSKLTHVYTGNDSNPEHQLEKIAKICSEHISSLVELKWSLSGVSQSACTPPTPETNEYNSAKVVKGKASLSGLRIVPSMLDLLHIPPIQLEVELNRESWSAERAELICPVGDMLDVTVNLFNALCTSLGPLSLQLSVYQDLQNGASHRRLDTRLLIIGSDRVVLNKVEADSKYQHRCSIIFFTPGTYKLDVVSSLLFPSHNSLTSSRLQHEATDTSTRQHVWKFVPPIEIIVSDL